MRYRLGAASCLVLVGLALAQPAGAVRSGQLGVYPSGAAGSSTPWFRYQLGLGQSRRDSITINNASPTAVAVKLYAVDAAPTGEGGFGMVPEYNHPVDAGGWVRLDASTLQLAPLSVQTVGFSFTVPARTSVGPHYAGIIVQPIQTTTQRLHGFSVQIVSRLGVRLYETVPGRQQPHLNLESFQRQTSGGHLRFRLSLRNTGNTLLVPKGQITVTNQFGRHLATLPVNLGTTLRPGDSQIATAPSTLSTGGLPQRYQAQVRLGSLPYQSTSIARTLTFWVGDFTLALVILGLLLILVGATILLVRRRVTHTPK